LGHARIPRNIACCEITVNLPSFSPSSSTMNGERDSVFIVDDLTKNPQTLDRPFVTGFPNGRFYAGVPITAPSGINIGAYCILGDEPRNGVSDKDLMFLRDMSRTVMTHLETVRAQAERERATHMVTGLGAFVKTSSDSRRWERRNPSTPATRDPPTSIRTRHTGLVNRGSYRTVRRSVPAALADTGVTTAPHTSSVSHLENADHKRPKAQEDTLRSTEQICKPCQQPLRSLDYEGTTVFSYGQSAEPTTTFRCSSTIAQTVFSNERTINIPEGIGNHVRITFSRRRCLCRRVCTHVWRPCGDG
jgi:hypothetical protein